MALQKVNRNLINSALADSSDATAITIDSSENTTFTANVSIADDKELIFGASSDLKIYHSGNVNYIKTNSDLPLKFFDAGGASMMEIIPNGAVNLYHNGNAKLSTNSGGVTITGTAILGGASFVDNATAYFGTDLDLRIYHDGSHARLRNSTGNFNIQANDFHITDSSNTSVRFYVDHNGATALYFNGSNKLLTTNTGISVAGQLLVNPLGLTTPSFAFTNDTNTGMTRPTSDTLQLVTGGNERLRIDSAGNIMVTKGAANTTEVGNVFFQYGRHAITVNATTCQVINRLGNEGTFTLFQKDNTAVGEISIKGTNDLTIYSSATNHTGIRLGEGYYIPVNNAGATADNAVDIGLASIRYKDLYLSGGAFLGGTGAANKLDDYEEGTWTVVVEDGSGNDCGLAGETGHYTKIGNLVYVIFGFSINNVTGVGNGIQVNGLPFEVENVTYGSGEPSGGFITFSNNLASTDFGGFIGTRANNASTFMELKFTTAGAQTGIANNHVAGSQLTASTYMTGHCLYRT